MQQDIKDVLAKAAQNRLLHKFDNYKESIQNPMGKQNGDVDDVSEFQSEEDAPDQVEHEEAKEAQVVENVGEVNIDSLSHEISLINQQIVKESCENQNSEALGKISKSVQR